uniref:Uncharacterized protein n=1 Tax=Propithecus coquereli TaxID=379532 RepID=A0A2K6FRT0_PROCO
MRGSAPPRTPELRCSRPPPPPRPGRPWLPSFLEKGRAFQRLGGKKSGGREEQYKSRFLVLYLTRCSNSSERQRERAGGPARVEEPSEPSRAPGEPGREIRSERGASPPAQHSGWALCTGTYNTQARTRLCGRGEAISPIWGYFSPTLPRTRSSERRSFRCL